tara:strand:+ start:56 stop:1087 length:1032 start_codon:yes stop_codon:yes gene_type:complete
MSVTTTRTLPAQFIEDLGKDYARQLTATTAIPVDTSKFAPTVAAQDALQTQAATLAGSGVGSFAPFIQAAQQRDIAAGQQAAAAQQRLGDAGQTLGGVATTLSGIAGLTGAPTAAQTQAFTSPFQQQVIDTTLAEFDRQRAINEQNIRDQQASLGALGSGRAGVQLSEFQTQSGRDRAALEAQLRQQGFQQAQAARQQDIANRFGLGQAQAGLGQAQAGIAGQQAGLGQQQLGLGQFEMGRGQFQTGLASQVPGLQRADISTLGQVGAAQQAQRQAVLDAQRQAARTAAYEPLERLGFFGSGVTGLMGGYPGQFQFGSTPAADPLQTALGLGTGLAGIFGALR